MGRRMAGAAALVMMAATLAPSGRAASAAVDPAHRLYVVSDSVVLGAKEALPRALPGWQVTVAGRPAVFTEVAAAEVPGDAALVGDVAVVATGYNYPYWDPARFDRSVDTMVANLLAAGAKRVVWVTLREVKPAFVSASAWAQIQPYYWYFPTVNEHLRAALARHPQLSLADWAAVADEPGLTYDAIHLNPVGAARMAELIRTTVEGFTRVAAGTELRVPVAGVDGVPADAAAVVLNVTAVDPARPGFLTVHPCGTPVPLASNLNVTFDLTVANHVVTGLGADGAVCVSSSVDAHVVVDLAGYVSAGGAVVPALGRALDTRLAGGPTGGARLGAGGVVTVTPSGAPAGAVAAVVNLTAVDAEASGFLTLYPCGTPPLASNVNHGAGQVVANLAVSALGPDGELCVFTKAATHVVMDVLGWIVGGGVTAVTPRRLVDTRTGARTRVDPATDLVVDLGAAGAPAGSAALVNVTVTDAIGAGFATVYPCAAGAPLASDVNVTAGGTAAGLVVAGLDAAGTVCVHVSSPSHVVVDLAGWLDATAGYHPLVPARLRDTRTDPRPF